jgi:hypothetical protein
VDSIDRTTMIDLLCGYKHLWLKYQELRYLQKHPDAHKHDVREACFEEVDELFSPVLDALSEGRSYQELIPGIVSSIERDKELPLR